MSRRHGGTVLAAAIVAGGCMNHHGDTVRAREQTAAPLGAFAPLVGDFGGELKVYDEAGEAITQTAPLRWRCEPSHWGRLLRIEFVIVSDDPDRLSGWTGLFHIDAAANECRTTWVSMNALGADGPTFGTRHIFAERGGIDDDGTLVLRATQQGPDGEPVPYRSVYTFTDDGMTVQDAIEVDGQWKKTVLFELRRHETR